MTVINGNFVLVNLVLVFTPVSAIGKKLYQVQGEWNSLITLGMDNGHYVFRHFGKTSKEQ